MTDPRALLRRDRCGTVSIDAADERPDDNYPDAEPDDWSGPGGDPFGGVAVPRWADNALAPEATGTTWEMQPGEPTPQERHDQNLLDFFDAAAELVDSWHGVLSDRELTTYFEKAVDGHDARRADDQHYADLADAASY